MLIITYNDRVNCPIQLKVYLKYLHQVRPPGYTHVNQPSLHLRLHKNDINPFRNGIASWLYI